MSRTKLTFVFLAMGILALSTSMASAQVALWEMNSATDSAGGESNLTLVGDFSTGVATTNAGAFISQQINAANSDGLAALEGDTFGFGWVPVVPGHELNINGSLSVFARVHFDSYNGIDDIIRLAASETVDQFALELIDGMPIFKVRSGGVQSTVISPVKLFEKTWYDITGVYDSVGQTLQIFIYSPVSGLLVTSATDTAPGFIDTGGDLLIFEDLLGANGINDGALMERAGIWAEALTPAAVGALSAVRPTVDITSSIPPGETNAVWIPVTVTFSEPVIGFSSSDVTVGNASLLNFNGSSASAYTFTLVPSSDGEVTVDIPQNVAASTITGLGNKSSLTFSRTFGILPRPSTYLTTPVAPGRIALSSIPMTVNFSEPVIGFSALDLNPSGATVANFQAGATADEYTFDLLPQTVGDVSFYVPLDVATGESSGLGNKASAEIVWTYGRPSVTLTTNVPESLTSVSPLSIIATFDTPVEGFDISDIQSTNLILELNNSSAATVFTFNVFPLTPGPISVEIIDGATTAVGGVLTSTASNVLSRIYDPNGPSFPAATKKTWTLYE